MRRLPPAERRIVLAGVAVVAVFLVLHVLNKLTVDGSFFSVDSEASAFTWLRSLAFAAAGLAALVAARLPEGRRPWTFVGLALLALSLDDAVSGHEWVEEQVDPTLVITVLIPLGTVLALAGAVLVVRHLDPLARALVVLAGVALVAGEAVGAVQAKLDLPYAVNVLAGYAQQSLEALVAILALAAARGPAVAALRRALGAPAGA